MNSRILILAAVLVIVAIAGYFYYLSPEAEMMAAQPTATEQPVTSSPPAASGQPATNTQ